MTRRSAVLTGVVLGAVVMAFTAKGRQTREFISESLFELRKVVWPTRQETLRITGVIPSTDNLPSGSAYKPGEIITMMNGKTVEIVNTDAL